MFLPWRVRSPSGDPGPGDAQASTVQLYMNGEIFSSVGADGLLWALATYGPDEGQTCMAYGPVEPDPAGGYGYENLIVLTATVSAVSSGDSGQQLLVGQMYSYSSEYDLYTRYGEYEYDITLRTVLIVPQVGNSLLMTEAPAELSNDDLVAQVQACHYFGGDASLAPSPAPGEP